MADAPAPKPRKLPQPSSPDLQVAEYRRTVYILDAHPETLPDDTLNPEFWAHLGATFKPWDRVEVRAHDGTWYREVMVLEASRQWARMKDMGLVFLTTPDVSQTQAAPAAIEAQPEAQPAAPVESPYEIKHRGPRRYSVIRISDKAVLHEDEQTRAGAERWLADLLKKNAAAAAVA